MFFYFLKLNDSLYYLRKHEVYIKVTFFKYLFIIIRKTVDFDVIVLNLDICEFFSKKLIFK